MRNCYKIVKSYAGTGLEPKIEVTNNAFKVTLPNRNVGVKESTSSGMEKTSEERILDLIGQNREIARSDVDRLLNVSQTTASRILNGMVRDGMICQEGNGRKTKYRKR